MNYVVSRIPYPPGSNTNKLEVVKSLNAVARKTNQYANRLEDAITENTKEFKNAVHRNSNKLRSLTDAVSSNTNKLDIVGSTVARNAVQHTNLEDTISENTNRLHAVQRAVERRDTTGTTLTQRVNTGFEQLQRQVERATFILTPERETKTRFDEAPRFRDASSFVFFLRCYIENESASHFG
jgi:chromosome segregation ATPase